MLLSRYCHTAVTLPSHHHHTVRREMRWDETGVSDSPPLSARSTASLTQVNYPPDFGSGYSDPAARPHDPADAADTHELSAPAHLPVLSYGWLSACSAHTDHLTLGNEPSAAALPPPVWPCETAGPISTGNGIISRQTKQRQTQQTDAADRRSRQTQQTDAADRSYRQTQQIDAISRHSRQAQQTDAEGRHSR